MGDFQGHPFRGNQWTDVPGAKLSDLPREGESTGDYTGPGGTRDPGTSAEDRQRQEWEEATRPDPQTAPLSEAHPYPTGYPEGGRGMWGASHSYSYAIAGHAADAMGIEGYEKTENSYATKQAEFMLEQIAADKRGSEETLYHGFQDFDASSFKPGDTMKLPLTATAGESDSVGYGIRTSAEDQRGPATLFVFEPGTQMMAYSTWKKGEDRTEFGHRYSEAIVAGEFKVTSVTRAPYPYTRSWPTSRRPQEEPRLPGAARPMVTIVRLKQIGTFNPKTGKWNKR